MRPFPLFSQAHSSVSPLTHVSYQWCANLFIVTRLYEVDIILILPLQRTLRLRKVRQLPASKQLGEAE